jgi:hypothetical protein
VAIARRASASRAGGSKPRIDLSVAVVAHFGLNFVIPQAGCGPLADIALVVGIGCAVSCRRPAEYLQCNFLNAIRIQHRQEGGDSPRLQCIG